MKQLDTTPKMYFLVKIYMAISLLLSITACSMFEPSDQKQIEAIVKDNLTDPESVIFGDFIISADGNRACIEHNSKNRYGGYDGQVIAEFKKQLGSWVMENLEGAYSKCTPDGFKKSDAEDRAKNEAIEIMAAALQKSRNISEADARVLAKGGAITIDGKKIDCTDASFHYIFDFTYNRTAPSGSHRSMEKANILLDAFNKGVCPEMGIAFYSRLNNEEFKTYVESVINSDSKIEN